ncbi:bifunctional hydroxymethylpyrimidine kinase/phosphomethylpyrimidine kinase [Neisseriaceae bacterium TC5R-5]|nr:bifunctional hydroxymethylpyrimidine kinase/phosphomethylpyrimidine kinase [Neisseriaceae bacterium TC5R-5]
MATPLPPPIVLTLAGSDPSGGAGIQADILTLASLGCHPLSVITAITVQDTVGINDFMVLEADWVNDQARFLMEDVSVAAFKIGMLGSVENVAVVAQLIADYPDVPVVLDPVLTSGGGHDLADEDLIGAMVDMLIPQVSIITPNSIEARRLVSSDDDEDLTLAQCAERLLSLGVPNVLITGTHENTRQVVNSLYTAQGMIRADNWDRLPHSYHGSGCTLASAIAGMLAAGLLLPEAVREAQEYTYQTLVNGFRPGMGQFLPDRLFWARLEDEGEDEADDAEKG